MKIKKILSLLLIAVMLFCISGCNKKISEKSSNDFEEAQTTSTLQQTASSVSVVLNNVTATAQKQVSENAVSIILNGSSASVSQGGANLSGNDIVITAGGTYAVSGKLTNGRIVVNAPNKNVKIILNGADINCNYSSALLIYKAKAVTVTAYEGSVNVLTDAKTYSYTDNYSSSTESEPDATLYSKVDLTVNGKGTLVINSRAKNGLTGKDNLVIEDLTLTVSAGNHGVTGKDSATIKNATLNITAGGDGLRSNNSSGGTVGNIALAGCSVNIVSGEDGIQAENKLTATSGTYKITAGGGSDKTPSSSTSSKGIKATGELVLSGGNYAIDSSDDALHSNGNITVNAGSLTMKSGDDGIHADSDLKILGGIVVISKSYEGLEATNVTLSGGNIQISADDDGINICGGDGSAEMGRPGMDRFGSSSGGTLKITGGIIAVDADGDGLDANGSIEMSGGTVMVDGPTNNGNGALDYDNTFKITGGTFIAVGSSGMAQAPSSSGTQNSLVFYLSSSQSGGTLFNIQDSEGNEIITYSPKKSYNWVAVSTKEIKTGNSYTAFVGGSHSGKLSGGIYSSGKYTAGTKVDTLSVSATVTSNGSSGMGGGFGGGHGGGGHGGFMW